MINGRILLGWALEVGSVGDQKSSFFLLCEPLPISFITLIKLATRQIQFIVMPPNLVLRMDYMWKIIDSSGRKKTKKKKTPIIPWNRIWDAHVQKGMKQKVSMGSLQRMTSKSARQCKFHISTMKALLVALPSCLYSLCYNSWCIKIHERI